MKPVSAEVLPKLPSGTARPTKPVFIAELEREVVGAAGFGWPSWTVLTGSVLTTGGVFGPVTDGVIVPVEIGVAGLETGWSSSSGVSVGADPRLGPVDGPASGFVSGSESDAPIWLRSAG